MKVKDITENSQRVWFSELNCLSFLIQRLEDKYRILKKKKHNADSMFIK